MVDKAVDLKRLCEFMNGNNTDYMGFMEINLDTLCGQVSKGVRDTVNSNSDHSRVTMASSIIPTTNDYKPDGTMNIVQGDIVGQIIESGQDEMGQWVYAKLAAKNDKIITIITAYQLCKVGREINHPRNAFVQDLLT
eukprot:11869613-Ditylum_brightwellii.AAC.1